MNLEEHLSRQREIYLEFFRKMLPEMPPGVVELLIEVDNSALEGIFKLWRADYFYKEDGEVKPTVFDADNYFWHYPANFLWGETEIEVMPFKWSFCQFSWDSEEEDCAPFVDWAVRRFDLEEKLSLNEEGFYGVIHYVTPPEKDRGRWSVGIDLGSVSVDAVKELIWILISEMGGSRIRVGERL